MDYNEIFSHVVQHTSIRVLLTLVATLDKELEHLDIKTTFVHGKLEEDILVGSSGLGIIKKGGLN